MSSTVRVRLDDALVGRLPPVCAMTGDPADGYGPLVVPRSLGLAWLLLLAGPVGVAVLVALLPRLRTRYVVRIPLRADVFARALRLRSTRAFAPWLGGLGVLASLGLRGLGPIAALLLVGGLAGIGAGLVAHLRLPWVLPSASADPAGRVVTLRGVHPGFAAAVEASARRLPG